MREGEIERESEREGERGGGRERERQRERMRESICEMHKQPFFSIEAIFRSKGCNLYSCIFIESSNLIDRHTVSRGTVSRGNTDHRLSLTAHIPLQDRVWAGPQLVARTGRQRDATWENWV